MFSQNIFIAEMNDIIIAQAKENCSLKQLTALWTVLRLVAVIIG
jgi:hypothetical protein